MSKPSPAIPCRHDRPGLVVHTQDGERVCPCGVVLEERMPAPPAEAPEGRVTLCQQVEIGGLPADAAVTGRRMHVHRPASSDFSSACCKLRLPGPVKIRAWHIFRMLRSHTDHTRAKCALFSICLACREAGLPADHAEAGEAIRAALGVKYVPSPLRVMSELHDDAMGLGIDSNERPSDDYYLNSEMALRQGRFTSAVRYDRFRAIARANFANMRGNLQRRVRCAVDMALTEMGAGA